MLRRISLPTDYQLLKAIYQRYYDDFTAWPQPKDGSPPRDSKMYVPIDCEAIAKDLKVEPDMVFGRLYYDLDRRYAYERQGSNVHLFTLAAGKDRHCVHFVYLAAVLAGLRSQWQKENIATAIAIVSVIVAVAALLVKGI